MSINSSREAQKKMMDAINRTYIKYRQGKLPGMPVVFMD
jgi:hypothetical protein